MAHFCKIWLNDVFLQKKIWLDAGIMLKHLNGFEHSPKHTRERFETLFERLPRAGDVEALEARAARAEDGAVVEPEACFLDDLLVERFGVKIIGAKVEPQEIGALGLDKLNLGQMFGEEAARALGVFFKVG